MAPAVPCKRFPHGITKVFAKSEIASENTPNTSYGCMVESHESTRQRVESSQPEHHEDHIAGKCFTSMTHYNLFHKFIPTPQARKIPDAKEAVDKEWKKQQTIPALQLGKVKSKKEVILEAQRDKKENPLCNTDGHMSSQECGVGSQITKVQRQSRAPW